MTATRDALVRDAGRLREIEQLGVNTDVVDLDLDVVAKCAASLLRAPIALVSIVGEHRLCYRNEVPSDLGEVLSAASFCSYTIGRPNDVFMVTDATADPRFAQHRQVVGPPYARSYLGAPLVTTSGFAIGALCVIDLVPRRFSSDEGRTLQSLARTCMDYIEHASTRGHRLAGATLPGAFLVCDGDGRLIGATDVAERLAGESAQELIQAGIAPIVAAERTRFAAQLCEVQARGVPLTQTFHLANRDRPATDVNLTTSRLKLRDGIGTISAIEAPLADRATVARLTMFEAVLANAADAVVIVTPDGDTSGPVVYVNESFTRLTGYSAGDMLGQPLDRLDAAHGDSTAHETLANAARRFDSVVIELENTHRDGSLLHVEWRISAIADDDGTQRYVMLVGRDVSAGRVLERYEEERSVVLEMAVRNAPLASQLARIVTLLRDVVPGSMGTVMLLNGDRLTFAALDPRIPPAFVALIDGITIGPDVGSCGTATYTKMPATSADIATDPRWAPVAADTERLGLRACWSVPLLGTSGTVLGTFALYLRHPGEPTPQQMRHLEETAHFAALVIDRGRDHERLRYLADHDILTGLPNRRAIRDSLDVSLVRARNAGRVVALMSLHINRFKYVNDAFGHHVGDRLLQAIAERLRAITRSNAALARSGGDEFVLIFDDLVDSDAALDRAQAVLEQFAHPFSVNGRPLAVRVSLGVALFPHTSTSARELFQAADRATFAAKEQGGGFAIAPTPRVSTAPRAVELDQDLAGARERGELELYYQPIFDTRTGRPVGAEALLRWNHPRFGQLGPGTFIPLAEANRSIVGIGAWVIATAARAAARWHARGAEPYVAVNVSAVQFEAPDFFATVEAALNETGIAPDRLHLEVTESLLMRDPVACGATLRRLKARGLTVVIDDFGTGYSSLASVQMFDFDTLKIDRSFISAIGVDRSDDRSERIVSAVMNISRALAVDSIAEGVETEAQFAFIRACGCAFVQGYYAARPMPESALRWDELFVALPLEPTA